MSSINERLAQLRKCMQEEGISAVIIPSSDPHQSEYPADRWKTREWISGFTGSAGVAVVTMEHAGLWTDARYFQIAEDELSGSEFELHKLRNQFASEEIQWIKDNLPSGSKVGIDGYCFSIGQLNAYTKTLSDKGITIVDNIDYFSTIWLDRPNLPANLCMYTILNLQERIGQQRLQR
jgi:Xaa-Pro aminopeptidase